MYKRLRNPIFVVKALLFIIVSVLIVVTIKNDNYFKLISLTASLFLVFLCDLIRIFTRIKIGVYAEMIYLVFIFVSLILGIDLELYRSVPYMDKVVHTTSGVLSAVAGVFVLKHFDLLGSNNRFQIFFIICFSMSVAAAWEIFEFTSDRLLGTKMQNLVSTGVGDTMFDMVCATLGAIVAAVYIEKKRKSKK
jgi:Predicted membrane protein